MKNITTAAQTILFATMLLCSISGKSQTTKGRVAVSGDLGLFFTGNVNKYENETGYLGEVRHHSISVKPSVSYFVIDNLSAGVAAWLESEKSTTKNADGDKISETKTFSFAIGPNVNYYAPVSGPLRPYAIVAGYYSMEGAGEDKNKYSGFGYAGGVGAAWFFNTHVSLNLQMNYSQRYYTNKANSDLKFTNRQFYPVAGIDVFF